MSYSTINKSKFGDCTQCDAKDTDCVKIGKELVCLNCNRNNKTTKQLEKQKLRLSVRQLGRTQDKELQNKVVKGSNELQRWFLERRKEMDGKCHHCQGLSCKHDDRYFKFSICHILPKAYFPSVATHESNWVELCFWNKNCHGNMDNKMLDLTEMACWDEIVTKFVKMYPHIAANEKIRIPSVLMQYVETEK